MRERKDVIAALRRLRVQTGSLACLGCGYEQSCSVRGCAILRAAIALLERDEVAGEAMDCHSGDYTVYRCPPEGGGGA